MFDGCPANWTFGPAFSPGKTDTYIRSTFWRAANLLNLVMSLFKPHLDKIVWATGVVLPSDCTPVRLWRFLQ